MGSGIKGIRAGFEMMNELTEVRYERLRPAQIVSAREACPVAYLPIGTLEWHGVHNPVGLDTLKAHALAVRCARRIGGLVFPALYYGESRETALMEANAADHEKIAAGMALPPTNFAPGYMHTTLMEQTLAYQRLLLHVFLEIRSLAFKLIVVVPGHYPLLDHARAAAALFQQLCVRPKTIVWPFTGYELVRDEGFDVCGDHAGKWETSLLMALEPDLVDLGALSSAAKPYVGVSNDGVEQASREFGEQAIAAILERVEAMVKHLLENYDRYQGHGAPQYLQRPRSQ
ncbi:MAG: creatininase family protein [Candidatus Hydrogenedentes bacterium]|nr:creatininase family protein [Candidatus Hydrogenedentota bacterium]